MDHAELVILLEEIRDAVGYEKHAMTEELLKRLKTKDHRSVIEMMSPTFIAKFINQPSQHQVGAKITQTTREFTSAFPPGMSKLAKASEIKRKFPNMAGWVDQLTNQLKEVGDTEFHRFSRTFTFNALTPDDLDWIGNEYRTSGDALHAIASNYFGVANDLRKRKVTRLGDLAERPQVYQQFIERLIKIREEEAALKLAA